MSNISVLLVDDERPFVDAMEKRLSKRKIKVSGVYSGAEALEILSEKSFDAVVLDVKMPGMDGIETLKKINSEHPLVEVIMLTGHATVQSAIDGMRLGAFDYLMKPCELSELLEKLRQAKDKKETHEMKIQEARARNIVLRRGD